MFAIIGLGVLELAVLTVLGVVGLIVAFVLFKVLGGSKKIDPDAGLDEDLAEYPPAPPAGTHRLTFEGQPVRLRLVVLAPAGNSVALQPSLAEGVLQTVLHGLGSVAQFDKPRIRIWPPQLSQAGFAPTFFRHVRRPEETDEPSKWILVAGPAKARGKVLLLGLALEASEPTTRGSVPLDVSRWPDIIRIQILG